MSWLSWFGVVYLEKVGRIDGMKHYQDITLLPGPEIPLHFLWEKLYQQLHLALVEIKNRQGHSSIGVAFPEYDANQPKLGSKLRLLSPTAELLAQLDIRHWTSRLSDYVHVTGIRNVPDNVQSHVCFRRIQPKSSNARLARRKARREGIAYEDALAALATHQEQQSNAPYIHIKSHSSGQKYRLFIGKSDQDTSSREHLFSTYGLSGTSSVPLF
jgi:CRISPR-associated endonuclease Csy4